MSEEKAAKDVSAREGLGNPLFDPKEKAKVDIVFVHGLGGDRVKTWTWENKDRPQFWPKTLLPKDCPTARIMSFGYDADFAHFYPQSPKTISPALTIDNYSTSLLQALIGLRGKTDTKNRPIMFVAHSLGGLVVANALSRPHGTDDASKKISDHTIGTLFLGTPFEGSDRAKYGSLAVRFLSYFMPTQPQSLQDLEKRSEKLASINNSFAKFLNERNRSQTTPYLEVACFFEARPLYRGSFKIGFIVPKESASWLGIDALSIPKDHIEMCKFEDEDDPDYKSVSEKLSEWIADIDKPREPSESRVGGVSAQTIGAVQSGNVDFCGASNHGGVMGGHNYSTASHGNVVTGTSNTIHHHGPSAELPIKQPSFNE